MLKSTSVISVSVSVVLKSVSHQLYPPPVGTFLPRAAGWASRLGIQKTPAQRGTGVFGGRAGPALADFFGFDRGRSGGGGGGSTGIFGGTLGPKLASFFGFGDDSDSSTGGKK